MNSLELAIAAVVLVLICFTLASWIVTTFCFSVHPIETFVSDSLEALLTDVAKTEGDICTLITRTDKFIEADQGKAGQDDPSRVSAAQAAARASVTGGITICPATGTDGATLADAENRIARMESTLSGFTGPELQKTYENQVPCRESFQNPTTPDLATLRQRLTAVQATLRAQETNWLKPVDDKNAALQRGDVSDCDKRRGASTQLKQTAPSSG